MVFDPRSDDGQMLGEPALRSGALIGVESVQAVVVAALQVLGHAEGLVLLESLRVALSLRLFFPNGLEDAFGVRIYGTSSLCLKFLNTISLSQRSGVFGRQVTVNFVMCQFGF